MTRSTTTDRRFGRRALALASLAAATTAVVAFPVGSASAESPAVVGPLLQIFTFGADVGVPTGCQAATATLGSGSAEAGLAQQAAAAIAAINSGCDAVQTQADALIAKGVTASAPLVALNSTVNPIIGSTADSADQFAASYGSALAPFGGTIAGVGGTINFFQGK